MYHKFFGFVVLGWLCGNTYASQAKVAEPIAAQKVKADFKVVPYDESEHKEAVVKLLELQLPFAIKGLSEGVPFYYYVCINEEGVVIGVMGVWGAEWCVEHLKCFAVHEQYQQQGAEEKLLEYHLKEIFLDLNGIREQISLMINSEYGCSTRTLLTNIGFRLHGCASGSHEYVMTRETYRRKFSVMSHGESKESL